MKVAVETLEKIAVTFMQSFGEYKDTDDFLQLSQKNLKSILVSDDIGIKELDLFHSAMRWAEFQCEERKVEPSEEHIREVLGDCLFEIRFPIMTNTEFAKATDSKDVLTAEESLGIYKFIGLEPNKKMEFDTKKLSFKTTPRKTKQALTTEPNPNMPGVSTLSLTRDLLVVKNPPFACDGSSNYHFIAFEKKIAVFGLGFLGPIENDGFYDVKVRFRGCDGSVYDSGMLEKHNIFAQKDKKFYFVFEAPIHLGAGPVCQFTSSKYYIINYHLKGPNTSAVMRFRGKDIILHAEDTKFRLQWQSNQLAEIVFKLIYIRHEMMQ